MRIPAFGTVALFFLLIAFRVEAETGSPPGQEQPVIAREEAQPPATARADMISSRGEKIGTVYLEQRPEGTALTVSLKNVPSSREYALHVHEKGLCEGPAFDSAGAHWNPQGHHHGFLNPSGPHAGDLPNIRSDAKGRIVTEIKSQRLVLDESLLDADGASVMVHENPDDYLTDPAGKGGKRIACGVIHKT